METVRHVVLIMIDGLRPDALQQADAFGLALHHRRDDATVCQHRRLRQAGRAAGILQQRDFVPEIGGRRMATSTSPAASRST